MGKILIYIIGVYGVYYLSNVIYDLFLAKDKVPKENDDGEVISLGQITNDEYQQVKTVGVDDVEPVDLPTSFDADEDEIFSNEASEEIPMEKLKAIYEEEAELLQEQNEHQEFKSQQADKTVAKANLKEILSLKSQNIISEAKEFVSNKTTDLDNSWDSFIEKAIVNVALTNNVDGHKSYKSTL